MMSLVLSHSTPTARLPGQLRCEDRPNFIRDVVPMVYRYHGDTQIT
jgi:hypothetical protein